VPEGKIRGAIFKKKIVENFPNLAKDINPQIDNIDQAK
jgi:hypothetical protein